MTGITHKIKILKEKCSQTFGKTSPPPADEISDSTGSDIPLLKSDFANKAWWEIDDEIIDYNFDNFPLLTGKAFHYYFPAFLLFSLNNYSETSDVLEFLIYELSPGEKLDMNFYIDRKSSFSKAEAELVIDFLKLILADEKMKIFHEEALKGVEFWQNQTS